MKVDDQIEIQRQSRVSVEHDRDAPHGDVADVAPIEQLEDVVVERHA